MPDLHIRMEKRIVQRLPARARASAHRHAAPSSPWPWIDLDSELGALRPETIDSEILGQHSPHYPGERMRCWLGYPQSLFPNWTLEQRKRSGIEQAIRDSSAHGEICVIYWLDMLSNGLFRTYAPSSITEDTKDMVWEMMQERRPEGTQVRALFVENLSGLALQMLGTRYNIEPFFFSSCLNWIPSRFQEALQPGEGDHITLCLTFVRVDTFKFPEPGSSSSHSATTARDTDPEEDLIIDPQTPLFIRSTNHILILDLLCIHMVRSSSGSTIVSCHASAEKGSRTSAHQLFQRVHFASRSVYWQNIFQNVKDPTCLILVVLWYAVYAWDEALEVLYAHICWLEAREMNSNDVRITQELHFIRAHILHYESLLDDFRKTIAFVRDTPNPAMAVPANDLHTQSAQNPSKELFAKECTNLISQVDRLESALSMQGKRLRNIINLTFSIVNIMDGKHMAKLAEASSKDSTMLRQLSMLTMVFLPCSVMASVFGMNLREISGGTPSFRLYLAITLPLTAVTVWLMVAFQFRGEAIAAREWGNSNAIPNVYSAWSSLWWPVIVGKQMMRRWKSPGQTRGNI